jgi:hypothetical protein
VARLNIRLHDGGVVLEAALRATGLVLDPPPARPRCGWVYKPTPPGAASRWARARVLEHPEP